MELRTLVITCLLGAAFAGPIARDFDAICSESCTSPTNKLIQFPEGKTYVYQYQSNVEIATGGGHSPLNVKMTAKVHIGSLSGCEMVMRLKDVDIRSANPATYRVLQNQLQEHPLRFSYDGVVHSICPHEDDEASEQVLNIKRALLTHLQLGAKPGQPESSVQETDILGVCKTVYKQSESSGNTKRYQKIKDLSSCKATQSSVISPFGSYESPNSPIQNIPLVTGQSVCQQIVQKSRVLQQSNCRQTQQLSPFAREDEDDESSPRVKIVTETSLRLVAQNNGVEPAEAGEPSDLLFASEPQNDEEGDTRVVRQVLSKLCQNTKEGVQPRTPYHINQLVEALRNLPFEEVKRIYEDLENDQPCEGQFIKDILLDALAIAGTKGPMKLAAFLIQRNVLSTVRVQTFFTLLPFNHYADAKVIEAFLPFLKDPSLAGRQSIFGVTALINNFCNQKQFQNNTKDCRDVPAVKQAIAALQVPLRKCQSTDPEEYEEAVHALIGFKNLGRVGAARAAVVECFARQQNPNAVKVAALEAFNRVPRHNQTYQSMMKVLTNNQEDDEIRIQAFSAAIQYAGPDTIGQFKSILKQERADQVSAFIWSYLTNMQESSSPLKKYLRQIIGDETLIKKLKSSDARSRFYEFSLFSKKWNAGYDVQASCIHEGKETVPRSVNLNTTIHLFGSSINVMELNARAVNLEHVVQKLFGPKGILTKFTLADIKQMLGFKESDNEIDDEEEESSPSTFSRFNILRRSANPPNHGKPRGSLGISVLGHQVVRVTSEDVSSLLSRRELFNLVEMVEELSKDQEVERSYTAKVLDTKLTMPTMSGFKMEIELGATVVSGFKAKGKADVRDLVSGQRNPEIHIEGHFIPSAAVEVQALITVHAGSEKPGLKAVFQMHTSNHIQGKILLKEGRIVQLRLDTPEPTIRFATVNYELYKIQGSGEDQVIPTSGAYKSQGCTSSLSKVLGVELCYHSQAPKPILNEKAPYLPNGGITAQIVLKKTDPSMKAFELSFEVPADRDEPVDVYKFEINTPGSRVDRHIALEVKTQCNPGQHSISARLVSPIKKLNAEVSWENTEAEQSAQASVLIDGKQKYAIQGKIETSEKGSSKQIKPTLTVTIPRQQPITLRGTITTVEKGQKKQINIDLQANRPINKPSYIRGSITKDGRLSLHPAAKLRVACDLKVSVPGIEGQVHGSVDKGESSTGVNVIAKYQTRNNEEQTASLALKVQNQGSATFNKISTVVELQTTQFPSKNAQLRWDYILKSDEHVENDVAYRYGPDSSVSPQIHLHQVSKLEGADNGYVKGSSDNSVVLKTPLGKQPVAIGVKTEWDRSTPQAPSASFQATYRLGQKTVSLASLHYSGKFTSPVQISLRAQVRTPQINLKYEDRLKQTAPNEFQGHTEVQWAKDKTAVVEYNYRMNSDNSKTHHEVDLKMKTPSMTIPLRQKALFKISEEGVDIRSQTESEGKPVYDVELHISPEEATVQADLNGRKIRVRGQSDENRKQVDYHIQPSEDEQYTGSAILEQDDRTRDLKIAASWGHPEDDSSQLAVRVKLIREDNSASPQYQLVSSANIGQEVQISVKGLVSDDIVAGPHDLKIVVDGERVPKSLALSVQHEIDKDHTMNCALSVAQNDEEKLKLQSVGKFQHDSAKTEISWSVSSKSPIPTLNGKELSLGFKKESSSTPKTNLNARVQVQPGKPYTAHLEIAQSGKNKNSVHLTVTTPLQKYQKQNVAVSYAKNRKMLKLEVEAANAQGQRVQGSVKLAKEGQKVSATIEAKTPYPAVKTLKMHGVADNSNGYSLQSTVDVNDHRKFESNAGLVNENRLEAFLDLDTDITAKYGLVLKLDADQSRKELNLALKKDEDEIMASKFQLLKQGKGQYSGQVQLKNGDFNWILDGSRTSSRNSHEVSASSKGLGKPVQINARWLSNRNGIKPELTVCSPPGSKQCLITSASYSNQDSRGQIKRNGQFQIQLAKTLEVNAESTLEISTDYFNHETAIKVDQRPYQLVTQLDNRKDGETEASIELVTPHRKSVAQAQCKRARDSSRLTASFVPDAIRQPAEKLTVIVTGKQSEEQYHYSAQVSHPAMESPKKASLDIINKEGSVRPLEIKATLELSPESEDQYVAHVALDDATRQHQNLTLTVSIYDQSRQNLDVKAKAHIAKVDEVMSAGLQWINPHSSSKHPVSVYTELNTDSNEYHYYIRVPRVNGEGHGSWQVTSKSFVFEENSEINGEPMAYKLTVDVPSNCAELVTLDETKQPSKRYHFCASSEDREELLSLTAESYDNEEKTTDASLVLSHPQDETVIRASLRWSPEKLGEVMYQLMEMSESNSLDASMITEPLLAAWDVTKDALEVAQETIVGPFIEYSKKEWSNMYKEWLQEYKHFSKTVRKSLGSLPNFRAIWEDLYQAGKRYFEEMRVAIEDGTPDVIKNLWKIIVEKISDIAEAACPYRSYCYELKYAYNRHGIEGVGELVYSKIENMPVGYYKMVVATKDLILENLDLPSISLGPLDKWWDKLKEKFGEWKEKLGDKLKELWESETAEKLKDFIKEKWDDIKEKFGGNYEKMIDYLKDLYKKIKENPEMEHVLELIKDIIKTIKKKFGSLHLEKATEHALQLAEELVNSQTLGNSIQVITMDPESGNIDVKLRYPDSKTIHASLKSANPWAEAENDDNPENDQDEDQRSVSKLLRALSNAVQEMF